jgi:hypothetical protein
VLHGVGSGSNVASVRGLELLQHTWLCWNRLRSKHMVLFDMRPAFQQPPAPAHAWGLFLQILELSFVLFKIICTP